MKQIIPCNVEMYAVYDDGENGELKERIIAFSLDGEGYFIPLAFSADMGADYADEPCNFLRYELEERNHIADSLDGINERLEHIDGILSGCVGYVPPRKGYVNSEGYNFLRIGGNVDTEY